MNTSFNTQFSYHTAGQRSYLSGVSKQSRALAAFALQPGTEVNSIAKKEELRSMLRSSRRDDKQKDELNPYSGGGIDLLAKLTETRKTSSSKKTNTKKYNYNPHDVSNKILQAKTSLSAAQAIRSATRKVQEVRRKLSMSEDDSDELKLALSHAIRMEMAAKKKKHNLEQEERVEITQKQDERADKIDEMGRSISNGLVFAAEDEVSEAEDAVFEARDDATIALSEAVSEGAEISEDTMEELSEQIAELGDELLSELEDMMEELENMEILDPHMSKEELEDIKRKHRNAEEKAILKANMDYLKGLMKLNDSKSGAGLSLSGGSGGAGISAGSAGAMPALVSAAVSAPSAPVESVSIDVAM